MAILGMFNDEVIELTSFKIVTVGNKRYVIGVSDERVEYLLTNCLGLKLNEVMNVYENSEDVIVNDRLFLIKLVIGIAEGNLVNKSIELFTKVRNTYLTLNGEPILVEEVFEVDDFSLFTNIKKMYLVKHKDIFYKIFKRVNEIFVDPMIILDTSIKYDRRYLTPEDAGLDDVALYMKAKNLILINIYGIETKQDILDLI